MNTRGLVDAIWLSLWMVAGTIAFPFDAHAAAGDADPLFGGTGYVRYAPPKIVSALPGATLALPDGSVIVAGGADTNSFVRHYRTDGSLDESFGTNGTTLVPGLTGGGRTAPSLHLWGDAAGRILVEQQGTVRRLLANGTFDATYAPATMSVFGLYYGYNLLPLPDGRFVIVSGHPAFPTSNEIWVRFFRPDGTKDTARGNGAGELLLYPGGEGTYGNAPVSAVADANGRILIAARWDRTASDTNMVLIRLNDDGNYDATFGQGGVLAIASHLGNVTFPQVAIGRDARITYLFGVLAALPEDSYFVVYVLTNAGEQDASSPSGGRVSVIVPRDAGLSLASLHWLSGSPELAVSGLAQTPSGTALMVWRADLALGSIGTPVFSSGGFTSGPITSGVTLSGSRLWVSATEGLYVYGNLGAGSLAGYARGVVIGFDATVLTAAPRRIEIGPLNGRYADAFTDARLQSDGRILTLGSIALDLQQFPAPVLTRFLADGRIDGDFGNAGSIVLASAGGYSTSLVPSGDDSVTVLGVAYGCGFRGSSCLRAQLWRFTKDGLPDATFGSNGVATVANGTDGVFFLGRGFVDQQKAVNLVRVEFTGPAQSSILPLRFTAAGGADPAFHPSPQSSSLEWAGFEAPIKLDALPDGRLQVVVVGGGGPQLNVQVLRWQSDGAIDSASPSLFAVSAADSVSYARSLDTVVLPDGRTLVAIDQLSQRIVLRLRSDGTLDLTFGDGGTARIDGVLGDPSAVKLAVDAASRVLLTYVTQLGVGPALTIARFSADGQRDNTFTADGRFDSLFSLSGNEAPSALLALPDGRILAAGRSGDYGLLLRLRGNSMQASPANAPVVEFFNTLLDHYFVTRDRGEIIGIDTGSAGPGWQRTGFGFVAYAAESGIPTGAVPVCRFYGTPGRGPNSHFYTLSASECASVKVDPGWTYEGIAFHALAPVNGQCASGQQPVYRAYNNRFAQNDSNHRYSTQLALLQVMTAQGWTVEGVVFCSAAG